MEEFVREETSLCPSARPELADSVVFGVISGTVKQAHVAYLKQPQPMTDELIAKVSPVTPAEVFRVAAPCANSGCQHFNGKDCGLVMRVLEKMPAVTDKLPPCSIRRDCRWWQQESKAACIRCPQIITDNYNPSEFIREVATPTGA
ncbi:nitrogen fixation protein [Mastigocoleus sp. MO_188.B34]|uniref:nitrogen fixation protein n=1 Tax=Mastigocoleus sp. MO_188.B34 TaxID=3036635 RepID=UPI00260CD8C5|nr:nitrogen fixation protein [Mastigocoleus sp. MO_188.B34]MDJ0697502.1 nitrogen fixation protein [Mastigocoleus sp. MO_188.B34]